MTLDKALTANPDLKKLYNEDEQVKYLIDMSNVWKDCQDIPPCMQQVL